MVINYGVKILQFKIRCYLIDLNCGTKLSFVCERLKSDSADTNNFVQPLSFGDGKPCPDGYSTYGGNFKN